MINPFQKNEVGLVYGKQRGNNLTKYSELQVFKKWFPNTNQSSENNLFCNNANAAIRKSIWDKINYDEEGLCLGFGLKVSNYRIDYSYNDYGEYLGAVNRFSIGMLFP